jgi:bifunctional non-homologous end joining protein LigD
VCRDLAAIPGTAILDGELVCLDADGCPRFYDLMYRRGECHYFAFDLLSRDGEDLRTLPLSGGVARGQALRRGTERDRGQGNPYQHRWGLIFASPRR